VCRQRIIILDLKGRQPADAWCLVRQVAFKNWPYSVQLCENAKVLVHQRSARHHTASILI
jgi:hypothetical protein